MSRVRGVLAAVVSLLMMLSVAPAALAQESPAGSAMPTSVEELVPAEGTLLGAWAKPRGGWSQDLQREAFSLVETAAGRSLDLAHTYYPWDDAFPTWRETWHLSQGRTPVINWNGTQTSDVISGMHDPYIRQRAHAVAALDAPVFLRWFWEMDAGGERALMVESAENYVAAWRHVHDIFAEEGVTNVAWVWCPNAYAFTTGDAPAFYPGDAYVDWVCADGYNWAEGRVDAEWRSLTEIFADFHAWGETTGKPMMIGETGVIERAEGEKSAWLASVPEELARDLPGIRAFMYFHSNTIYPWWLDSSVSSQTGWAALANHPHMSHGFGGTTDPDGGTTDPDGGTTDPDGGTTDPDGGTTDPDGGTTDPDGGTTDPDGGTTDPDGGTTDPDGGTTDPDGGTTDPDGGTTDPDGTDSTDSGGTEPNGGGADKPKKENNGRRWGQGGRT